MRKFTKLFVGVIAICSVFASVKSTVNAQEIKTSVQKSSSVVQITADAPTSDFGNQVQTIKFKVKDLSINNLKADNFHIEFPKIVDESVEISKHPVKSIKKQGNEITLIFDSFSYNQDFNVICSNSKLSFGKKDIKFNLGDVDKFEKRVYQGTDTAETLNYRFFKPNTTAKAPLLLVLHGGGEVGSNNEIQLTANDMITGFASDNQQAINKAYIVAPQLPAEFRVNVATTGKLGWNEPKVRAALIEIIKDLEKEYPNIDNSRIYVTGASMGGMGTWGLITSHPDLFAAAMPVCGQGDISLMDKVKDLPIWTFHAADDPVVPMYGQKDQYKYNDNIIGTKTLVYRLKELGSNIRFTEYSSQDMLDAGVPVNENVVYNHFSWVPAYNNQEAINWLFNQKK